MILSPGRPQCKTTTVYAVLSELNKPTVTFRPRGSDRNTHRRREPGADPRSRRRNFSYCCARSCVQDPDIIMVGEVRDSETRRSRSRRRSRVTWCYTTLQRRRSVERDPPLDMASSRSASPRRSSDRRPRLLRKLCSKCNSRPSWTSEELVPLGYLPSPASFGLRPARLRRLRRHRLPRPVAVYELCSVTRSTSAIHDPCDRRAGGAKKGPRRGYADVAISGDPAEVTVPRNRSQPRRGVEPGSRRDPRRYRARTSSSRRPARRLFA